MAFVIELTAFSHHDDGDILERHSLLSDPNAENVAIFRDTVAEALEMGGFLTREHAEFDHYSRAPHDQETYAIGLKVIPTLFDEEPDAQHLALTLGSLARFDLGELNTHQGHAPATQACPAAPHPVQATPWCSHAPRGRLGSSAGRPESAYRGAPRRPWLSAREGDVRRRNLPRFRLDHRSAFFTDEPLETTIGSSDMELLRCLLNAACLTDLRNFSFNPAGLQGIIKHGLLQWD